MSFTIKNLKLASKLTISVVITVIAVNAISTTILAHNTKNKIEQSQEELQQLELRTIVNPVVQMHRDFSRRAKEQFQIFSRKFSEDKWSHNPNKIIQMNGVSAPELISDFGPISNYQVDSFRRDFENSVATIFDRTGNDFIRIATTLTDANGNRAVGTLLNHEHPAYDLLMKGKSYTGIADLFGKHFFTIYEPVVQNGKTIAVLFIGMDLTNDISDVEGLISIAKFGDTGYSYIVDQANGKLIAHPNANLIGKTLSELNGAEGDTLYESLKTSKKGKLFHYSWSGVEKVAMALHLDELNWLVATTADQSDLDSQVDSAVVGQLINGLVIIVISALVVLVLINRMLNPVKMVMERLADIAKGDLSKGEIPVKSNDEIGALSASVNTLSRALLDLIKNIVTTSSALNVVSDEILADSHSLRSRTDEQLAALDSVATSTEEISVTINQVAQNSIANLELAQDTRTATEHGQDAANQSQDVFEAMMIGVTQSTRDIAGLDEASKEIESVISVIDSIAQQTNLLALNAAIEAARAGEAGRGFAVVADEVRNLSQRTAQSTSEIVAKIKQMQDGVQNTSKTFQQIMSNAEKCKVASTQITTRLEEVVTKVAETENGVEQTSTATEQQACAIVEISDSIQSIKLVTNDNASAAADSSQKAEKLKQEASSLNVAVSQFKIN